MKFILSTIERVITVLATLLTLTSAELSGADLPPEKPNIIVILVDDMGFSDLGCYGSEIETPHLDKLAAEGLRFSQFYNTAKCHSSRISLLTGRYPFQAGNASLQRAVTLPEVLGTNGYFTAMTGKWHLDRQPTDFGFQRYFGHLSGSCSYFKGDSTFRLNDRPWTVPAEGFYTTIANVDYALKFLTEARQGKKPWFLYLAFNAPHAPLQPLEVDYKKYLGRYDVGWDVVREARYQKQKSIGLFRSPVTAPPRPDHIPAWNSLPPETRSWESKRMAAYAGMIDRVDQELGRLIDDIRTHRELENTLILFVSDNGACPFNRRNHRMNEPPYDGETSWSDSTGWAWARNTPFRFYKQNQFEGGIATPAIVHWPAGIKARAGSIADTPAHLIDTLPTLAEVTGATIPITWPGRDLAPVAGISLGPVLAGNTLATRPLYFLYGSDRALREGDWKITSFRRNPWELYYLAEDRTEMNNLASKHPELLDRLAKQWSHMAEAIDRAPAAQRGPLLEVARPISNPEWTKFENNQRK